MMSTVVKLINISQETVGHMHYVMWRNELILYTHALQTSGSSMCYTLQWWELATVLNFQSPTCTCRTQYSNCRVITQAGQSTWEYIATRSAEHELQCNSPLWGPTVVTTTTPYPLHTLPHTYSVQCYSICVYENLEMIPGTPGYKHTCVPPQQYWLHNSFLCN